MQNNEARGGNWAGDITFSNNTSNPLNTNFAYANTILGVFSQYTETDKYRITQNRQWWSEWYAQDTWQLSPRATFDYGARFLWYSPFYRPDGQVSNFDPSLYDPNVAPRLYVPAIINGARVAYDPVTGQALNSVFIGAYVPGTGKQDNGMVKEADPGVPQGFRNVGLSGSRTLQVRAELYNLFNQVEFQDIDRTARFDADGSQINPNFGTAIGIANPTRPPRVIQLSARFTF